MRRSPRERRSSLAARGEARPSGESYAGAARGVGWLRLRTARPTGLISSQRSSVALRPAPRVNGARLEPIGRLPLRTARPRARTAAKRSSGALTPGPRVNRRQARAYWPAATPNGSSPGSHRGATEVQCSETRPTGQPTTDPSSPSNALVARVIGRAIGPGAVALPQRDPPAGCTGGVLGSP